ncbi:TPM domain-containing protein [Streptomyces sp. NPDC059944]|uniref:TPM domain-containing protein n=1 Tax=unclassified Streptomyces TaxID=2593676 RepID=UPI003653A9E8
MAHAVLGGLVAVGWLVLPLTRGEGGGRGDGVENGATVTVTRSEGVTAPAAASSEAVGATTGDLVPPLVAAGAAGALAAHTYGRRRRRATTRTTPGGSGNRLIPLPELDLQARQLLVDVDNCVRASAEELGFAAAQAPADAVAPYREALARAEGELRTAFRLRRRLDDTDTAPDGDDRRESLEEIVARCRDAGRRLDAAAPGFDQLRALERETPAAVEGAETRFRELAARTPATEGVLAGLHERYAPTASYPVAGDVEQAKDRLVFATLRLNQARQCADRGEGTKAAASLRAAEAAVAQAGDLLDGVDRRSAELATTAARLPAALASAETARGAVHGRPPTDRSAEPFPVGGDARLTRAEALLAGVRREMASGPYDPPDALRRVVEAGTLLPEAGAAEVPGLRDYALLSARGALTSATGFIGTHRGAVGSTARTWLAEAERLLGPDSSTLAETRRADALAQEARRLAERDVRAYGTPSGGDAGAGTGGAVLGGILLGDGGGPVSYGGPRTRGRRPTSPA